MRFSLHYHPTPQYFFLSVFEVASHHHDQFVNGKTINASFEEFKGKETFFTSKWLKQKGLKRLCEIFES